MDPGSDTMQLRDPVWGTWGTLRVFFRIFSYTENMKKVTAKWVRSAPSAPQE